VTNDASPSEPAVPIEAGALVEMLRRELEASKSVTDHIQFLKGLAAGEPMTEATRAHLVAHIGEEEAEHQAHLARLLPALEGFAARLEGTAPAASRPFAPAPSSALTVGDLSSRRPWFVGPSS